MKRLLFLLLFIPFFAQGQNTWTIHELLVRIQSQIRAQPPNNLRIASLMDSLAVSYLPKEFDRNITVLGGNFDLDLGTDASPFNAYRSRFSSLDFQSSGGHPDPRRLTFGGFSAVLGMGSTTEVGVSPTGVFGTGPSVNFTADDSVHLESVFINLKDASLSGASLGYVWTLDNVNSGTGSWQEVTGAVSDVTGTSPISVSPTTGSAVVSIANAAADGSTKGAASFTANDFNATTGNISIDYTNGTAATSGAKGFLTSADWTTFNNKQATGLSWLLASGGTLTGNNTVAGGSFNTTFTGSGDDQVVISGSGVGRSGIQVQATNASGNATFYFQNNRGSFQTYGGLLTGGMSNSNTLFGLTRADKTFLIHDGASGLGLAIGTLTATPITFGTNNASRMVLSSTGTFTISNLAGTGTRHVTADANGLLSTTVLTETFIVAASDETSAIAATPNKVTFRMPRARTLTGIRASLTTAQASGSIFTVDVHESGTTILSTKITIDNTEKTSTTAVAAPVISDNALADDAEITIDVDQIGDGTATGLKVTFIWN